MPESSNNNLRTADLKRLADHSKANSKSNIDFLHYKSFHTELRKAIEQYAKGDILDIGCGNKPYESWFDKKVDSYIGCDIVQSDLHKVDILCPANHIPLEAESFDTVISFQTIEHVEDYQGLVKEAYRLLKKDGYFILSGPMYWYLHEQPYDFFRFTKYGFSEVLKKCGFEVAELRSNGGMWALTGLSINHSFINSRSKNFFLRICCTAFKKLRIYWFINSLFGWLDDVDFNDTNTINYVVVGKKIR